MNNIAKVKSDYFIKKCIAEGVDPVDASKKTSFGNAHATRTVREYIQKWSYRQELEKQKTDEEKKLADQYFEALPEIGGLIINKTFIGRPARPGFVVYEKKTKRVLLDILERDLPDAYKKCLGAALAYVAYLAAGNPFFLRRANNFVSRC